MEEKKENDLHGGYSKRQTMDVSEASPSPPIVQEIPEKENPLDKKNSLKYLGLSFGIILMIIIIGGLFFIEDINSEKISNKELLEGATMELREDSNVKFKLGEEDHEIKIDSVKTDSVDIIIRSEPIKLSLKIDEIQEVDIDGDGSGDLIVKLIQIVDGKPTLAIKKVEEGMCVENWKCEEWTECKKREQERKCVDLNECGGNFGIPPEKRKCSDVDFVNQTSSENQPELENEIQPKEIPLKNETSEENKTEDIFSAEKDNYSDNSLNNNKTNTINNFP